MLHLTGFEYPYIRITTILFTLEYHFAREGNDLGSPRKVVGIEPNHLVDVSVTALLDSHKPSLAFNLRVTVDRVSRASDLIELVRPVCKRELDGWSLSTTDRRRVLSDAVSSGFA